MVDPGATPDLGSAAFWLELDEDPKALAAAVCFIDMARFDQTLQRHASMHAWIAAAFESARIAYEETQWELDKASARALLAARGKDEVTGKTKTDAVTKAEALLAKEVDALTRELRALDRKKSALKQMERSLNNRKDLLVEIARRQRHEWTNYSSPPNAQRT